MRGLGLLKGMAVTLKTLVGTYLIGQTDASVLKGSDPFGKDEGITTVCYPEQKIVHPENFRFFSPF